MSYSDYDELIISAAEEHEIPVELLRQMYGVESGYDPTAESEKGARGIAQLMPDTAAALGVNPLIPKEAIPGGARYLRQMYNQFGTWPLALAAYNAGPGNVRKHKGIPPFEETQNFVKKLSRYAGSVAPASGKGEMAHEGSTMSALSLVDEIYGEETPRVSALGIVDEMFKQPEQPQIQPAGTVADVQKSIRAESEHERVAEVVEGHKPAIGPYGGTIGLAKGMGVESPEEFDPYQMGPILTDADVAGFKKSVSDIWNVVKDPKQFLKGVTELAASLPGYTIAAGRFGGGVAAAIARRANLEEAFFSGMKEFEKAVDWWSGLVTKPAGEVITSPATVGKELAHKIFGGEPSKEEPVRTEVIAEAAFAPFAAGQMAGDRIANDPMFADSPNVRGFARFFGFFLGGALMHKTYKGGRQEFTDDASNIMTKAAKIKEQSDAIKDLPDAARVAQEKVLQFQKEQLEREAAALMEKVEFGEWIKQDLRTTGRDIKEIKQPKKYIADEAINKALERIKEPRSEKLPKEPKTVVKEAKESKVKPKEAAKTKEPEKPKVVPEEDPHTDVDLLTGRKAPQIYDTDTSPFRSDSERTQFLSNEFTKGKWKEDIELTTQKLINDVNKWLDGDDTVNINEVRNTLSTFASRADELKHNFESYGAETGGDPFLDWKDTVSDAAVWARSAERTKGERPLRKKIEQSVEREADRLAEVEPEAEPDRWSDEATRRDLADINAMEKLYGKQIDKITDAEVESYYLSRGKSGGVDWFGEGDLNAGVNPKVVIDAAVNLLEDIRGVMTPKGLHRFAGVTTPSSLEKKPRVVTEKPLKTIETEFTLDKTNLLPTLLKDIANQNPSRTMVYELMQNSLDALPSKGGKVDITVIEGKDNKVRMEFTDNGKGMSPEEVKRFFLVGGSIGKSGTTTRGGYGLAKIAFTLIPERIELETTKDGITSRVSTDRDSIYNGKIYIVPERTGKPSGTTLTAHLPEKIHNSTMDLGDIRYATQELMKGIWTDAEVRFNRQSAWSDAPVEDFRNTPGLADSMPKKIEKDYFERNGSKVNIHYLETEPYGYDIWGGGYAIESIIANKGLVVDVKTGDTIKTGKMPINPDFRVVVDFVETPSVRDPRYPFLKNRTELEKGFIDDINRLIEPKILQLKRNVVIEKGAKFREMYDRSRELSPGIKILNPLEGEALEKSNQLIDREMGAFKSFSDVMKDFSDMLKSVGEDKVDFHITIDPKVYGYKSNVDLTGLDIYAINPIAISGKLIKNVGFNEALKRGINQRRLQSDAMTHTLVHEFAHKREFSHTESFASELGRLVTTIGHEELKVLTDKMRRFYDEYGDRLDSIGQSISDIFKGGTGLADYSKSAVKRGPAEGGVKSLQRVAKENRGKGEVTLGVGVPVQGIPRVVKEMLGGKSIKDFFRNKEVFQKTGWWLGKDNKWRYELDDSAMTIRVDTLGKKKYSGTLEAMIDHPTLFRDHPEMKNVKVLTFYDKNGNRSGGYSRKYNTITARYDDYTGLRETIVHEIQHALQHKTVGAFKGTTIVDAAKEIGINESDIKAWWAYRKTPGEMEARLASRRMRMDREQRRAEAPWETLDKMLEEERYSYFSVGENFKGVSETLYSGAPLDKMAQELIKGGRDVIKYYRAAKEATRFKPGAATHRLREEFNRAFIDRSGNLRPELLSELGEEGHRILQKAVLSKGAGALSARNLRQMQKEVFGGLSGRDKEILDKLVLTKRMIDIGSYKKKGEFFFPEEVKPEKSIVYQELFQQLEGIDGDKAKTLKDRMNKYFEWMKRPLEAMLDAGLISKEEFDKLVAHNYRRIKLVDIVDRRYGLEIGEHKRTVYDSGVQRLARGRDTDIYEPSAEIMALEVFNRAYGRVMNNKANQTLLELARNDPANPFVRVKQQRGDKIPQGWKRIFVYENGKRLSMHLHPDVAKEWIINSPEISYRLAQFIRIISGSAILRPMATGINWGFALANLPRDIMHAWWASRVWENGEWKPLYSSNFPMFAMQMARDQLAVFGDAALKKGRFDDYIDHGGGMELLVHQGKLLSRGRRLETPIDKVENLLGYFGETTELMTRLSIQERVLRRRAREAGISLEEARKNPMFADEAAFAARDYFDFGQGGGWSKAMDNGLPYLNAAIQGTRGLMRAFKDNPVASTWKVSQLGIATVGTYLAAQQLAPNAMRELEGSHDSRNNFVIPLPESFAFEDENGQMRYPYLKIPLDPGQKFFKTFFEAAAAKHAGRPVDVDQVVKSLKEFSPVGVTEMPPSMSAMIGYITNKDFWLNEDIWRRTEKPMSWPASKEEYVPGKTHQAFVDIGQATGLSPERMQYAVEEVFTSGTIWSYLLGKGYDEVMGDLPKAKKEQHFARTLSEIPGVKRFIGVTNPYSKHASSVDKAREAADVEYFVQTRGLDMLADSALHGGPTAQQEVWKYIGSFKDPNVQDRLTERFDFHIATKDLPERSFWLRMQGLKTPARAQAYVDRMKNASEKEKESLRKEIPIVDAAGGVFTDTFWDEVVKIQKSLR